MKEALATPPGSAGTDGGSMPSPKKGRERRGRRDNSVGRPRQAVQVDEVEKLPSMEMIEVFRYLEGKGEKFEVGSLLKDPTKVSAKKGSLLKKGCYKKRARCSGVRSLRSPPLTPPPSPPS